MRYGYNGVLAQRRSTSGHVQANPGTYQQTVSDEAKLKTIITATYRQTLNLSTLTINHEKILCQIFQST